MGLCAAFSTLAHANTTGNNASPQLQSLMQRLHCTQDLDQAKQALAELCLPPRAWPFALPQDERIDVLDALLWTMDQAASRFPSLEATIEDCVLSWNLCGVRHQRQWVDRVAAGVVCLPSAPTAVGWQGLKRWGLVADAQVPRRIPARLRPSVPERGAHPQQLHRSYHEHCFPHPVTGRLFDEETRPTAYGGQGAALALARCKPDAAGTVALRDRLCPPAPAPISEPVLVAPPPVAVALSEPAPSAPPTQAVPSPPPVAPRLPLAAAPAAKPPRPVQQPVPSVVAVAPPISSSSASAMAEASPVAAPPAPEPTPQPSLIVATPTPPAPPSPSVVPPPVTSAHDPEFGRLLSTGALSATAANHAISATPPGANGWSGAFSHDWPLNGSGRKLSATATWAPAEYWFIRLGVANAYEQGGSQPWSYSWGVGYDDWHPGTWSVQLNHWGPIVPGKGLDIKNAVFTTSYKTDHAWLKAHQMTLAHGIDLPVGQPRNGKLHSTWQWAPWDTWFLRVGVSAPLQGLSPLQWSYGFGRSDWRPSTWSLEYNNWGPNTAFQPNFKKNGTVTLAWKWAY